MEKCIAVLKDGRERRAFRALVLEEIGVLSYPGKGRTPIFVWGGMHSFSGCGQRGVDSICVGRGASLPFAFEEDGISEELRSGPLWWKETEYILVRGLSSVLKEGVVQS